MKALMPLNRATGVFLPVFLATCEGVWGIKMAQPADRAPFFALMGPKRRVTPGEVVRGMRTFYKKILVDNDGLSAISAMNAIVDQNEDVFRAFNCEDLFKMVWDGYLADAEDEAWINARVEDAVAQEHAKGRTGPQLESVRVYMRHYIQDHPARFEESRRKFFMIDVFPANDARFNLTLTPAER
jgi:hypothetical protein